MKKHRFSVLSSLVMAALSCSATAADIIYSQLPNTDTPGTSDYFGLFEAADAVSGQRNDQMTADNFILTDSDAIITGVRWWGGSDNYNSSDLDNFSSITVKFLMDVKDAINNQSVLYKETDRIEDTNPTYVGFAGAESGALAYQHYMTFKQPIRLCRGRQYWISIGATNVAQPSTQPSILTSENGYMWYGAKTSVDDNIWIFNFSDIENYFLTPVEWSVIAGDQSFELEGTKTQLTKDECPDPTPTFTPTSTPTSTPTAVIDITTAPTPTPTPVPKVPIPPAVWLFGSGLAGLFAAARKRKGSR